MASLELFKLLINNALSRKGSKLGCFNVKNFYLGNPCDRPEYVKIKLAYIIQEFLDKYDLKKYARNEWI